MRLLLLLIIAGVAAWYTNPTREAHELQARTILEAGAPAADGGLTLDDVIGYAKGMLAGEGRYENYYLLSKYTVDMPGASFVECYGAYTFVNCRVVEPNQAAG
ncbi:hypothetical protein U91I_02190 [alpha proteobacterium U9-1i]|nr:hypothetical protein U91I_02190 [alpha proteobacterium U9-1i]